MPKSPSLAPPPARPEIIRERNSLRRLLMDPEVDDIDNHEKMEGLRTGPSLKPTGDNLSQRRNYTRCIANPPTMVDGWGEGEEGGGGLCGGKLRAGTGPRIRRSAAAMGWDWRALTLSELELMRAVGGFKKGAAQRREIGRAHV